MAQIQGFWARAQNPYFWHPWNLKTMVFMLLLEFLCFFYAFFMFFYAFLYFIEGFWTLMPKHSKHSIKFEPQETCSDSRGAKNKDFGPWPKTLKFGPNPSFIFYRGFLYFLGMVLYFYTMFLYFLEHLWSPRASWRPPVAFWGLLWPPGVPWGPPGASRKP